METGKIIKIIRTSKGHTQQEFSRQIGISPNYLSMIESSQRLPKIDLLKKMASQLGVPASVLLLDEDDISNNKSPKEMKELLELVQKLLWKYVSAPANKKALNV